MTISGYTPLLLSQVVGFQGNGNINGSLQKQLNALAVAKAGSPADICMLALAGSGDAAGRKALADNLPTSGLAVLDFAADDWSDVAFRRGRLAARSRGRANHSRVAAPAPASRTAMTLSSV